MSIINKKIGIVGGGQLGKMMVLEAKRLGFYVAVLDPSADCPAHSICDEHIVAPFEQQGGYFELARKVDVVTYEFEHINAKALEIIEQGIPSSDGQASKGTLVYPSVSSLKTIQNKFTQKSVLQEHGIPVPRFSKEYTSQLGTPQMFKASTGGYDGKGNWVINDKSDIPSGVDGFFEELVDFEMEISVLACRGINGEVTVYPVGENIHADSILDTTIVPARIASQVIEKARAIADRVMEVFEGVGTFCVEMFVAKAKPDRVGQETVSILVNEVAPRPHNSGHYTIEGCFANQFENHIRAITGLPLGSAELIQPAVMVNLLGESDGTARLEGLEQAYLDRKSHVHFYGKRESKVGRKMGHFTVVGDVLEDAIKRAEKIKKFVRVVGG